MSRILDLARKTYNYVVGDDNEKSSANKTSASQKTAQQHTTTVKKTSTMQNTIMPEQKMEATVDTVVKKSTNKKESNNANKDKHLAELKKKMTDINNKCKKLGISLDNILTELGKADFMHDFISIPYEEKLNILDIIEKSLNDYENNTKNKDTGDLDQEKAIAARVKVAMQAIKDGLISDAKELSSEKVGNINSKLGKNYKNLSKEEQTQKFNEIVEENVKKIVDYKFANKLKQCKTEKERAIIEAKKAKYEAFVRAQLFMQFSEIHNPEEALNAIEIMDVKDIASGLDYILFTKIKDKQKRTKFADNKMNVEYIKKLLKSYFDKGQTPPKEVLQTAIEIMTKAKSYEGVQKFDNEYYEFRLDCEENGNPPYITDEQLTAMSIGLGTGITINENMNTDEKAYCLNSWDEHAKHFSSDYLEVKSQYNEAIKQYLNEHPEAKQGIEEIETKLKEEYGKVPDLPKAGIKRLENNNFTLNTNIINKQTNPQVNSNQEVQEAEESIAKICSTTKDIAQAIKSGNITTTYAIAKFHEKGYDAIFEDPDLFARNATIAKLHINNHRKDLKKLLELSHFSSAIQLIAQNISPIIKEEYVHEVKLSAITRDAIFGKEEKNAVN